MFEKNTLAELYRKPKKKKLKISKNYSWDRGVSC